MEVATAIGEIYASASPRASHQVKNRVTAAAYAARVCGLRIWAVKNSTVRSAACGPARLTVAGRPSICQPPDTTSASGATATGARATGSGRPVSAACGLPVLAGGVRRPWHPTSPSHNPLYATHPPPRPQLVSWTTIY